MGWSAIHDASAIRSLSQACPAVRQRGQQHRNGVENETDTSKADDAPGVVFTNAGGRDAADDARTEDAGLTHGVMQRKAMCFTVGHNDDETSMGAAIGFGLAREKRRGHFHRLGHLPHMAS